jgi:hypothetical protein
MNDFNFTPQGWECPKCKRVYSPTTSMCSHCPEYTQGVSMTGTSTSTTHTHQFESDKKSSSFTKCKICGLEKWQHSLVSYT